MSLCMKRNKLLMYRYKGYTRPHQLEDLSRCKSIIEMYGGNYLSHLIYSGDKDVFMHEAQQAF